MYIQLLKQGHIAILTVSRPEALNALNMAVLDELELTARAIGQDRTIRALVVTGAGKAFVAGADISEMSGLDEAGAMDLTGFEDWELQSLLMQYDHIKDLMEEDFSGYDDGKERSTFTMTFSLPAGARETVEEYMKTKENAKAELATAIINKVKGVL